MSSGRQPIFIRGMSRSGGTLMCTLLDAHRDIAISYELYPEMLVTEKRVNIVRLAHALMLFKDLKLLRRFFKFVIPSDSMQTFLLRVGRGGLDHKDFANKLLQLNSEGLDFTTLAGRMRMVELLGEEKMKRTGKSVWGMKNNGHYADYLSIWPKAFYLNMLRDGRDVLSSQLNTGSFNPDPERLARNWSTSMMEFDALTKRTDVHAHMVRYESLTRDPEPELRRICEFLQVDFDPAMLQHDKQDLTIFKVNHLSGKRVASAIDTSMIGRWQRDLSEDQLSSFMRRGAGALKHFNYLEAAQGADQSA